MTIDQAEIEQLTVKFGEAWGINHTRRLLQLISVIGQGQCYNTEAVWIAAHLHDWGAYAPFAKVEVDHAVRSTQVARFFLDARGCPPELKTLVLESILLHHASGDGRSLESILLRDADALDFLGVVGIMRDFSRNPHELRKAIEVAKQRRANLPAQICLPAAQVIAAERVREMDELLAQFEAESFGCF